jgi:hypothetical protein
LRVCSTGARVPKPIRLVLSKLEAGFGACPFAIYQGNFRSAGFRTKSGRSSSGPPRVSSDGIFLPNYSNLLLNYLHDVSKFVAVFLHIFNFDFFTDCRSAEGHEFSLEAHVHVDQFSGAFACLGYPYGKTLGGG